MKNVVNAKDPKETLFSCENEILGQNLVNHYVLFISNVMYDNIAVGFPVPRHILIFVLKYFPPLFL
jgi:hypothetical protein